MYFAGPRCSWPHLASLLVYVSAQQQGEGESNQPPPIRVGRHRDTNFQRERAAPALWFYLNKSIFSCRCVKSCWLAPPTLSLFRAHAPIASVQCLPSGLMGRVQYVVVRPRLASGRLDVGSVRVCVYARLWNACLLLHMILCVPGVPVRCACVCVHVLCTSASVYLPPARANTLQYYSRWHPTRKVGKMIEDALYVGNSTILIFGPLGVLRVCRGGGGEGGRGRVTVM